MPLHASRKVEKHRDVPRKGKKPWLHHHQLVTIVTRKGTSNGGIGGNPLSKRGEPSEFQRNQGPREGQNFHLKECVWLMIS